MSDVEPDGYLQGLYDRHAAEITEQQSHTTPRTRYAAEALRLNIELLGEHCPGRVVLDLGCGAGDYFALAGRLARFVVGVDLSQNMLSALVARMPVEPIRGAPVQANARALPLGPASVEVVFSFATLVWIPDVDGVILEAARVLKRGGIALFEFGNSWSLHTPIYRRNPLGLRYFRISTRRMRRMLRDAGFTIVRWRAFQFLPLVGGGPWYLRPLTTRWWRPLFERKIGGRMLDEIVSSAFPCRPFAACHIVVCVKQ